MSTNAALNYELLTTAANHLESLKDKRLPMCSWLYRVPDNRPRLRDRFNVHECGYAGCAIGECSFLPEFQAVGITPLLLRDINQPAWSIVRDRLGLTEHQASWLFEEECYPDFACEDSVPASEVAARIRVLLSQPDFDPDVSRLHIQHHVNYREGCEG